MWFFFFKVKILNYTCGLHYFYGQCCPRGRRWCSSGERQSSGLSNCSINRHALRLSVWALFFLICRKPSAADAWAYGSSLMQIEWFLVLLTIRLKSSFLGFACWLPTSCLLSGFQKFIFFYFFIFLAAYRRPLPTALPSDEQKSLALCAARRPHRAQKFIAIDSLSILFIR